MTCPGDPPGAASLPGPPMALSRELCLPGRTAAVPRGRSWPREQTSLPNSKSPVRGALAVGVTVTSTSFHCPPTPLSGGLGQVPAGLAALPEVPRPRERSLHGVGPGCPLSSGSSCGRPSLPCPAQRPSPPACHVASSASQTRVQLLPPCTIQDEEGLRVAELHRGLPVSRWRRWPSRASPRSLPAPLDWDRV